MNVYECKTMGERIAGNPYVGRGVVIGKTEDGIRTEAHDPAKLSDPSLIIYHPVRRIEKGLIVTNGDQTDTIRDYDDFRAGLLINSSR